jgi:SNF2-related domain/Helicase conserved C-terminal domain/SWIM zinc finger
LNDLFPLPTVPGALTPPYDETDIRRCLGYELDKGRAYQRGGAVRDLRTDKGGERLIANVDGTRTRPYRVFAEIHPGSRIQLSGQCSCPVGINCKHVAAVFLEALRRPPQGIVGADPLAGSVGGWLDRLRRISAHPDRSREEIVYVIDMPPHPGQPFILEMRVARVLKSGAYGADRACPSGLETSMAGYVQPEDRLITRLLGGSASTPLQLPDDGEVMRLMMEKVVATGRCRWRQIAAPPLARGPLRSARVGWQLAEDGRQSAVISGMEGGAIGLPCSAPWYVDPDARLAGPLEFDLPPGLVAAFLAAPPIDPVQAAALGGVFDRDFRGFDLPRPQADLVEEVCDAPPVPVLRFANRGHHWNYWSSRGVDDSVDIALLGFAYDGRIIDLAAAPEEMRRVEGGRLLVQRRNIAAERAAHDRVRQQGLGPAGDFGKRTGDSRYLALGLRDAAGGWPSFVHDAVPPLAAEGWRIEFEDGFRHRVVEASGDWTAAVSEGSGWWFSLDLGIEVEGERVPLLPVLADLLQQLQRAEGPGNLDRLAHHGTVFGRLADGRLVALPLERTKAMLSALVELYHPEILSPGGTLDISAGEGAALAAIEAATQLRWLGGERLRALVERLAAFSQIESVAPPAALKTQLRSYQQTGLDWLQFLRAFDLGGILADDMGLGKTVQTLAHVLVEKREGRLDRPCLVICPTSVVPNWYAEAARLAPELRVLSLHGADRAKRFCEIHDSDLVLTTYALLPRDADRLLPIAWHIVVLDESQAIKNVAAKATQLVCRLDARHRLCLTGTPVENHLGELWSQFAFLMPGLLGDAKRFARVFRNPIEKHQDDDRRAILAARVKPFLLRRTKAIVAADLPPKNEIPIPLELAGPQRDLYETVRLAMHEKVRREVAKKGFARSHIVILDALLKLRQVCCDPRLVKLAAARGVSTSVKLAHLLDMLPPLIEDGRHILLFSQFTGMLDLIKPQLAHIGIEFVELRGDTMDRTGPVARFQAGEVPLFLISLRAGGTGLNLTAADAVIHYDPWWNPAVEDQATDRAHRIGQDKAVFVYKMLTQGTVEERMVELQQRKRALAAGIHDAPDDAGTLLGTTDIERLFAPLPV